MEKKNEELYIYAVHPRKAIVIDGVGTIRSAKSVYLSKEDVFKCLKKASVYRRFPFGITEKVNIDNVDRLHRENYMTEEEYTKFLKAEKSADHATISNSNDALNASPVEDENEKVSVDQQTSNQQEDQKIEENSDILKDESNSETDESKQDGAEPEVEKGLEEVSDEEVVVNEDKEAEKEVENSEVKEESNENIHDKTQKINQPYYSNKKNNKK